jgi:hypothetical protein
MAEVTMEVDLTGVNDFPIWEELRHREDLLRATA